MTSGCKLSVNINKVATIRNARGGNVPDLVKFAKDVEAYGANGITVHPRPDERHIRYQDVRDLKAIVSTELNIEGFPSEAFLNLVEEVVPDQVTLVPDPPDVLTSNAGWKVGEHMTFLVDVINRLKKLNTRISLFLDPDPTQLILASSTGTDRVELYTEAYASGYHANRRKSIAPYKVVAVMAAELGLELNAGHDLSLDNLGYFANELDNLKEVSIGHALISDALYFGIENTVQLYQRELRRGENHSS